MKTNCKFILILSFLLFVFNITSRADESLRQIIFEKGTNGNEISENEANTKRDLELQLLLPVVMYDISSKCFLIESQHIAFESITYYIINEDGAVFQSCEISLPRNVVQSIPLLHLPSETYCLVLEIDGMCFKGYFEY